MFNLARYFNQFLFYFPDFYIIMTDQTGKMKEYLETLNKKQLEAVLHTGSPLLILAGAGSGKTRVITTKIVYLIKELGVNPYSILAVTFTNKAANEMKNRVLDMCPDADKVMLRTFHSFGAWLLRRNSHILGLNENFLIYDEEDKIAIIKSVIETSINEKIAVSSIKHISHCISRAKDNCLYPTDDLSEIDYDTYFPLIYQHYYNKLNEIGNVDFGDLIMLAVKLLNKYPEVRKRTQQRFRVILVDEFQDSNPAQLELLKALYDETNYLCVVGDEDQSIYKFRGAEVKNIIEFPEIFAQTQVIMLEQNYRSTPNILDVALNVVSNNQYRMGKNLWTEIPDGELVKLAFVTDQDEEARFCVHILKDMNFNNTAILYRNNYQSRAFETLFQNIGIPYRIVGSLRFYEREEIKDVLAWLHILLNPRDEVSFFRILNKPSRGLGKKTVEKILKQDTVDLIEATRITIETSTKKTAAGLEEFIKLYNAFSNAIATKNLSKTIEIIYQKSGLYDYYREKDSANSTAKIQNLYEMVNAASAYPQGREAAGNFLDNITLGGREEDDDDQGKVTLITIHNTKGLEFDRVIITGLEDGLFPHLASSLDDTEGDIEEERRLFYVAITRARKELYLTSCHYRRVFGDYRDRFPSRFLSEIPEELMEILGQDSEQEQFCKGDYVKHNEYGLGIIADKWYSGNNLVVLVQFENGKAAQLLPKYAHLEKIHYE